MDEMAEFDSSIHETMGLRNTGAKIGFAKMGFNPAPRAGCRQAFRHCVIDRLYCAPDANSGIQPFAGGKHFAWVRDSVGPDCRNRIVL